MFADKIRVEKRSPQPARRAVPYKIKLAIMIPLIIATLAGLVWQHWFQSKVDSQSKLNTVKVEKGFLNVEIVTSGMIKPYNEVKISPKTTLLLKRLLVVQGQNVKQGQMIAQMDDSNLLGQVAAARAAVGLAESTYLKNIHGNRPQEIENSKAQVSKYENAVQAAKKDLEKARAAVASAKAQLNRDSTNARRLTELARQGAISDQDRLNAVTQAEVSEQQLQQAIEQLGQASFVAGQSQADLESARQQYSLMRAGFRQEDIEAARYNYEQARGNLVYLESLLADTSIRAPFTGVVTQKYTDEGAIVTPTTSAATMSATSSSIIALAGRLELVASVSETDIEHLRGGQPVEIHANAYPDRLFHGKVYLIAPEAVVTANVTTFEVHATITDDPNHLLMSGMNVTAHFPAKKLENVLLLPTVAIISERGESGVLVPDKIGNPVFKAIKLGATSGTKTAVRAGLKAGDAVFASLTPEQLEKQGYASQIPGLGKAAGPRSMLGGR